MSTFVRPRPGESQEAYNKRVMEVLDPYQDEKLLFRVGYKEGDEIPWLSDIPHRVNKEGGIDWQEIVREIAQLIAMEPRTDLDDKKRMWIANMISRAQMLLQRALMGFPVRNVYNWDIPALHVWGLIESFPHEYAMAPFQIQNLILKGATDLYEADLKQKIEEHNRRLEAERASS